MFSRHAVYNDPGCSGDESSPEEEQGPKERVDVDHVLHEAYGDSEDEGAGTESHAQFDCCDYVLAFVTTLIRYHKSVILTFLSAK